MVFPNLYFMHKQMATTSIRQRKEKKFKKQAERILKCQGNGILQTVKKENVTSYETAFLQPNFGMD